METIHGFKFHSSSLEEANEALGEWANKETQTMKDDQKADQEAEGRDQ